MTTFSTKPWSKPTVASFGGDASRYCAACLIDSNPAGGEKTASNCSLPYKEPSGAVNVGALRAILAVLGGARGGVSASSSDKAKAKATAQRLLAEYNNQGGGRSVEVFRARPLGYEVRQEQDGTRTLVGELAVFNEWTEINSRVEGNFMERISPGAFKKTIQENLSRMRCLFQHGKDPQIGEKPLGPISTVRETERGVEYEVPLLDTSYNRDISEMLLADPPVLGSSFRFAVTKQDRNPSPGKSAWNPRGIMERTVQEVRMSEFGPVTFPAYAGAGAGLRSITDRLVLGEIERMDYEDLDVLSQMICLAVDYIGEQDDPGDEANIPKMESIIQTLYELQGYEIQEEEAPEDEGAEEMSSSHEREEALADGERTSENGAGIDHSGNGSRGVPLYTGSRKKEEPWRL